MHISFLRYRNFFYLKLALGVSALALLAYVVHAPAAAPNGGTWLGYTLGTLSLALVGWLAWFGIRKRTYRGTQDRLMAWLSAHVYLGIALVFIVSLHSGFQLGMNVHGLAYLLTVAVVVTGLVGLYCYVNYPRMRAENAAGMSRDTMLNEIAELDRESLELADGIGPDAHRAVLQSIEQTVLGGTIWQQVLGDPARHSGANDKELGALLQVPATAPRAEPSFNPEATTITLLTGQMLDPADSNTRIARLRNLIDLVTRRRELVERLQRDIQYEARLHAWLYLHVPLTVALLAALLAHVVAVFFYW